MKKIPSGYLQVTAALIPVRGRLFIAQRPPNKKFGLCWEFPGGKAEPGEDLESSLVREIKEELCWDIVVGKLFRTIPHHRDEFGIDLHAFWCTICGGKLNLLEHIACCWATVEELIQFKLTEADRQLALLLADLPELPQINASTVAL